jgi:cell shape-determining protein MreC
MSYLLDKKIRRKKILTILLSIFFLGILFFFGSRIWGGLSYVTKEFFHPILIFGNSAGEKFKNLGAYFLSKKSLNDENEALLLKLLENEAKMLNYDAVNAENIALKEIFDRSSAQTNKNMILSAILSKPNQSAYDTLITDGGANLGIKIGDTVFAYGNIPIGRIGTVTPNSSTVILFSSSGEKTPAIISNGNVFYELIGRGGGNFEMLLPRDIFLQKGDQAIKPGIYPYVLALVESIISDPRDPFTKALLSSPVNIQELKFVEIESE